jgi:hypothetical protein
VTGNQGDKTMSDGRAEVLKILEENLRASAKVAKRLLWSCERVAHLMPLDATKIDLLSDEQEESFDALLLRFNSLTAMVQDHITRGILTLEEEDVSKKSQRDRRILMERLGALKPELKFGTLAELRNRIAHFYPDENAKQAEILNEVHGRTKDLIEGYNEALQYADRKFFGNKLDVHPVVIPSVPGWGHT